ncbi:hypothetical protein D9M70_561580 [compost metagenome]
MQQGRQHLFWQQAAVHRRGLLASHQVGAEEQLQRALLAQLAKGAGQGLGRDVDVHALGRLGANAAQRQGDGQAQGQQALGACGLAGGYSRYRLLLLIVVHVRPVLK